MASLHLNSSHNFLCSVHIERQMSLFGKIAFLFLGTVLIDASIHASFTTPFETTDYWLVKFFLVSAAGYWLLTRPNPADMKNIVIATVLFAGALSVYYRSFELLTGYPFGHRVPTWVFGSKQIAWDQHPVQSTLLWAITHFGAFFLPAFYITTSSSS